MTSSSLALVEDEAAFDVVGGLVWHWAEGMGYYVVSAKTMKGWGYWPPHTKCPIVVWIAPIMPGRPTARFPFADGVQVGRIPGEL